MSSDALDFLILLYHPGVKCFCVMSLIRLMLFHSIDFDDGGVFAGAVRMLLKGLGLADLFLK